MLPHLMNNALLLADAASESYDAGYYFGQALFWIVVAGAVVWLINKGNQNKKP